MRIKDLQILEDFADKVSNAIFIKAIRRGLVMTIPFMLLGSFAIFINNLPIPAYQQFMLSLFGEGWRSFGGYLHQATFAIMALIMNLLISHTFISERNVRSGSAVSPFIGAIVSLCCFFALIYVHSGAVSMENLGAFGVFIAILTALSSSSLFISLHKVKRLWVNTNSNAFDSSLTQLQGMFFSAILTISAFVVFRLLLSGLFGVDNIHAAIYGGLRSWFDGMATMRSVSFIFVTFTHLLWFLGIHGSNILDPIAQSIFVPALIENQILAAYGLEPVNIFTKQFFDVFVYMGGAGTTLSLIAAIIIGSKRAGMRQITKMSLFPGLINVNEIIIFGVPLVFNFYLLLPFVCVPLVLTFISYIAIYTGLVPFTIEAVEWTTPIIIGGFITTGGSVSGSLLQVFNFIVATLLYLPFIKLYEKSMVRNASRTLASLTEEVFKSSERRHFLLGKQDAVGRMARELVIDMENDFKAGKIYANFQPQMNFDNTVFGAETLVRWKHEQLGFIPPPVMIALAEESNMIHEIGYWVFEQSASALRTMIDKGFENFTISVNVSPSQLGNPAIADEFAKIARKYNISPNRIEIEITEQIALGGMKNVNTIKELQSLGFLISMDDFGMGHSSLMYLKEFNLSTIKLDGSLTKEILANSVCADIISSIVHLGQSKSIHIIAEFVETQAQRERLHELGCNCYQGYLFSPPVSLEALIKYCKEL